MKDFAERFEIEPEARCHILLEFCEELEQQIEILKDMLVAQSDVIDRIEAFLNVHPDYRDGK